MSCNSEMAEEVFNEFLKELYSKGYCGPMHFPELKMTLQWATMDFSKENESLGRK